VASGAVCPRCGATAVPELELGARPAGATKTAKGARAPEPEVELELAVDPHELVEERANEAAAPAAIVRAAPAGAGVIAREPSLAGRLFRPSQAPPLAVGDLAFDAHLLADYGTAPQAMLLTPLYALRVLQRRRELRLALVGRREEAARTASETEDALVAFAERVRPAAEKQPSYAVAVEELRRAEDLLRSRDRVLASEQDAQNARIAQVDTRLSKLEEELAQAQADERAAAGELAAMQAALAREEAKYKRAEVELRAAQQRESSGEVGG
jgi:hypothetical protein